jgi:Tat protein translocase TatB subunit
MFGSIGGPELILILVLALLLFGPRRLPQIGRTIGKALAEFRSVTTEFKSTLDREVALDELKQTRADLESVAGEVKGATHDLLREASPDADSKTSGRSPSDGTAAGERDDASSTQHRPDGGSTPTA